MAGEEILDGALAQVIPKFDFNNLLNGGLIFLGIITVGIAVTFITIILINKFRYNQKIKVFGKIGNVMTLMYFDKAVFERIGLAGDYWCRLKKLKKIVPMPRLQMAKNEWWFFRREDGELINFTLADLDDTMKAKCNYIDEDMRLQRLGIQKNLENNFKQLTFFQKYGAMIGMVVFMVIITVCLVVIFREMKVAWSGASTMAAAVRDMALEVKNIRGSGAVPA